jgi:hypothetical protein
MTRTDLVAIPDTGIAKLLNDYFDVIWAQDLDLFDKVFHKDSCLYSSQTGELTVRPYQVYRDQVAGRVAPADTDGNVRADSVLDFDQISPTLAWVRVQLQMFGGLMQDYLNLCFIDGQWWIVAKMYERVGDAVQ